MRDVKPCDLSRFWSKVDKTGECWVWRACIGNHGYGQFGLRPSYVLAHRFSYELANGPIGVGLCVLHRCDNRRCVNPEHLFLGTRTDNARDRDAKGRAPYGERHPMAKLTAMQVADIRAQHAAGAGKEDLAARFGVTESNVGLILRRQTWVAA